MAKNSIREKKNAAWFSNQENVRTHFFGRTLTIHSRPSWPPCLHYVPITRRRRWGGMNDDEAYNQRSEQKDEKTSSLALSHSHSLRGQPGPVFTYFCHKTLEIMVLFPLITKLLRGEPWTFVGGECLAAKVMTMKANRKWSQWPCKWGTERPRLIIVLLLLHSSVFVFGILLAWSTDEHFHELDNLIPTVRRT